jgi:diphthamide biosynthesis protein 3|tara:strand:+ start:7554 stop:7934 length:381 start_codon:yes stop_codon:yes gene_type:complete
MRASVRPRKEPLIVPRGAALSKILQNSRKEFWKTAPNHVAAAILFRRASLSCRNEMSSYDEVDLEDMEWNPELGAFTFQCPCGDVFQITPTELRAGEEIAHCPSCSLVVTVVYEDEDLTTLIPDGF